MRYVPSRHLQFLINLKAYRSHTAAGPSGTSTLPLSRYIAAWSAGSAFLSSPSRHNEETYKVHTYVGGVEFDTKVG